MKLGLEGSRIATNTTHIQSRCVNTNIWIVCRGTHNRNRTISYCRSYYKTHFRTQTQHNQTLTNNLSRAVLWKRSHLTRNNLFVLVGLSLVWQLYSKEICPKNTVKMPFNIPHNSLFHMPEHDKDLFGFYLYPDCI